jgi:DNA polymerase-1
LELEFTSLLNRLGGLEEDREVEYKLVDCPEKLTELSDVLGRSSEFAFDTETTSKEPVGARLVGLSFSTSPGEAYYIPVGHTSGRNIPLKLLRETIGKLLENGEIVKIGHNIKYDMIVLEQVGIAVKDPIFDTMIASYLLEPSRRQHGLDSLAMQYFCHRMIPIQDLIGKGKKQKCFSEVEVERASEYSCEDADFTLQLKEKLTPVLQAADLYSLFNDVEIPLIFVLSHMEMSGISVDPDLLGAMSDELEVKLRDLEREIYFIAGEEFNINSTRQLSDVLFGKLKLPAPKKTKTGFSTDISVLEQLAPLHDLPGKILNYRQIMKLKSTYLDALPRLINEKTGRIHTSYNQTVTSTGRLSSSDPNLQNIPIRTELGREIRRAFIPENADWMLLSADYSQIELRILAHLSGDPNLKKAFVEDSDIHRQTASLIFNIPPEEVDSDNRQHAKVVNFGVIYGMGSWGLSKELQISQEQADEFISNYFNTYPGVKTYQDQLIEECRKKGYVTTLLSRRRYLPEINSSNAQVRRFAERVAINTPIQGSAADLIKVTMIHIFKRMKKSRLKSKMILQVHDELVFEVHRREIDCMTTLVRDEMETGLKLDVPLKVTIGVAGNWLEAH